MNLSDAGLNLIKASEGFRSKTYRDVAGLPTIGYGHKILPGESYPNGITETQASALLVSDVYEAEHAVSRLVKVPLTQGQYDALVSFAYNLGAGTLERSTLLKLLNGENYAGAADQFLAWDHAAGREVEGLKRRREAERQLFKCAKQTIINNPTNSTNNITTRAS